jgi:hypothetical protein
LEMDKTELKHVEQTVSLFTTGGTD